MRTNGPRWKGQVAFASFLVYYLKNLNIPSDEKYDFWNIEPYLPELMVDAFEQLRMSKDEQVAQFRKQYEEETGHEVPNITDLGASNILDQGSAIQTTLGFMLKDVTGQDWIEHKIDTYCNAQKYVLQQTFDKFLRLVYRRGLADMIEKCNKKGMSGKFVGIDLRTYVMAGRIMFTFAKRIDTSKDSYYKKGDNVVCNEHSVSFVGSDDDPLCLSAGIQSVRTDFRTALDLIEDVIKWWPQDIKEQKKMYKADAKVGMSF
ncbi:MAG TPA: hypothetical protein VMV62_01615 [Candidatus Paceibacterota bacterium]|nr:hypothetical protein [Candidatus Paceibacterota bacterium]